MSESESIKVPTENGSHSNVQNEDTPIEGESLSNSSNFNYSIQGNWSMIFTDDNSTDLDIHSNSSYDSDTHGDVVSESDSNHAETSGSIEEETRFANLHTQSGGGNRTFSQGNSISTIIPIKEENDFTLPDPLSSSKKSNKDVIHSNDENDGKRTKIEYNWSKISHILLYFLTALILVDKGLQLTNISLFNEGDRTTEGSIKLPSFEPNSWTFVQYKSKDVNNNEVVSRMSVFTGEPSSWDLLKALVSNVALSANEETQKVYNNYKNLVDQGLEASKRIPEQVSKVEWETHWKAFNDDITKAYDSVKSSYLWKESSNQIKKLGSDTLDAGNASYHYFVNVVKNPKIQEYQKNVYKYFKDADDNVSSWFKQHYNSTFKYISDKYSEAEKSNPIIENFERIKSYDYILFFSNYFQV